MKQGIGIYIHIPFCKSKCSYCDFVSFSLSEDMKAKYVHRLVEEIRAFHDDREVETVFFGGGTPSLLRIDELNQIMRAIRDSFFIKNNAEITMEANPGTMYGELLYAMKENGINRISFGAQSHDPRILKTLGRIHLWDDVESSVYTAKSCGVDNINIDLMLGVPHQSVQGARESLALATQLPISHISCYGLIVEEKTRLARELAKGLLSLPEVEEEREMYETYISELAEKGFEQYEVSNFAKAGFACKHNIGCWKRVPYIGFGVSAHSLLDEGRRKENSSDLDLYIGGEEGKITHLSQEEQIFEGLMLGLRMCEGINLCAFQKRYGVDILARYKAVLEKAIADRLMENAGGNLFFTQKGMNVMNRVLVDLMDEAK